MSLNGISTLVSKQLKQTAKLAIAEAKRKGKTVFANGAISGTANASQPWARTLSTLDIDLLPTKYSGNVIVDNTKDGNILVAGRPWVAYSLPAGMSLHEPLEGSGGNSNLVPGTTYLSAASSGITASTPAQGTPYAPGGGLVSVTNSASGLYREKYVGNMWSTYGAFSEFDIAWFSDPSHGPIGVDIYGYAGFGLRSDLTAENNYSMMWRGYVRAPATGTFTIWTAGTDDDAACWIGTAALNPTYANMNGKASGGQVTSTNSVTLTGNQWYPIRFVFTEFGGWEQCQWFLQDVTHSTVYNGTDLTWAYNTATKGY